MHVHFAAGAALDAMRLSRITGIPFSVTAHAYEIFEQPANLREKLEAAAFVTTGCEYNRRYLGDLVSPEAAERIHVIVMGVDPEAFKRTMPYPGGRHVVAVGRLIEKKGFAHLIDAAAELEGDRPLDRLTIVGEGPLRQDLTAQIDRLGLAGRVELAGALPPAGVRDFLERADLLAMPAVVAANGDRDSMPVVVKEAMAMEIPVVASDEVGLPELVRDEFGRLAPPGDAPALARAIAELLDLPADRRAEMGRAARAHVLKHGDLRRETAKLAALIDA
jgi:glycosyltransferase involved in cell wall biosynthesis